MADPWTREEDARVPMAGTVDGAGSEGKKGSLLVEKMKRWHNIFEGHGKLSFLIDHQATAIRYIVLKFPHVAADPASGHLTLAEQFVLIWQSKKGNLAEYSFFGSDEPFHNALFGACLMGLRARNLLEFVERDGRYLGKYFLPKLSGEAPQDSEVMAEVYNELASEPKNSLKVWFEQKSGKWGQDSTTQLTIKSLQNRGFLGEGDFGGAFSGQKANFPILEEGWAAKMAITERIHKLVTGEVKPEDDTRAMVLLALCRTADMRDAETNFLMRRIFTKDVFGRGEELEPWLAKVDDLVNNCIPAPRVSNEEIEKMIGRLPKETRDHLMSDAFKAECKENFNRIDKDGTGFLEAAECAHAVNDSLPREYMDAMNVNEASMVDIVTMFDSNHDHKIELAEFVDFLKWVMGMKVMQYFTEKKC